MVALPTELAGPANGTIMKTYYVRAWLLAAALGLLAGCKSVQLYETRAVDMLAPEPPRLRTIPLSDQPIVVVELPKHCGWGEQTGTIWLEEAVRGRTVWSQSEFMRAGFTYRFTPQGLARGTYIVTLEARGEAIAISNFDVQ